MRRIAVTIGLVLLPSIAFAQTNDLATMDWNNILLIAVAGFFAVISAIAAILAPAVREWLRTKSKLAFVLRDDILGKKLDAGIIAIIRDVEKLVTDKMKNTPTVSRPPNKDEEIVKAAAPKVEAAFKETLDHFGKDKVAVEGMVRGRIDKAISTSPNKVINVDS